MLLLCRGKIIRSYEAGRWKASSVMQSQAESQKREGRPSWSERRVAALDWSGVALKSDEMMVQRGVSSEGSECKKEERRGLKCSEMKQDGSL